MCRSRSLFRRSELEPALAKRPLVFYGGIPCRKEAGLRGNSDNLFVMVVILAGLSAASCTPAQDDPMAEVESEATPAEPDAGNDSSNGPPTFADTAWRSVSEDGARYTTMLDRDGTYRDLRNGDPWQQGSWTYAEVDNRKELCFLPDAENGVERCWTPGRMEDGTLIATGPGERRIELERVDYQSQEVSEADEAEESEEDQ